MRLAALTASRVEMGSEATLERPRRPALVMSATRICVSTRQIESRVVV